MMTDLIIAYKKTLHTWSGCSTCNPFIADQARRCCQLYRVLIDFIEEMKRIEDLLLIESERETESKRERQKVREI